MCFICLHHCPYSSCWPPSLYIKYLIFPLFSAFKVLAWVLQKVYKATYVLVVHASTSLTITCGKKKSIAVNSYFNTKKKSKCLCGLHLWGEVGGVCGAGVVREVRQTKYAHMFMKVILCMFHITLWIPSCI